MLQVSTVFMQSDVIHCSQNMCPVFASCMQKMQHRIVQLHSMPAPAHNAEDALLHAYCAVAQYVCRDRHFGQMQMVAVPPKRLHCTAAESQESSEVTAEPATNLVSYVLAATATQPKGGKTVLRHSSSPVESSWHTSSR